MKILFITEYYPSTLDLDVRGGVETRTYQVASFLSKKHQVNIIAAAEKGKPKEQILNGVNIYRVGFLRDYTRTDKLSRIIFIIVSFYKGLSIKFDLVEGAGFWGFFSAFLLGSLKRSKKIILIPDTIDNYAVNINIFSKYILKIAEKIIFKLKWDQFICISKEVKRKIVSLGCNKNSIAVIYCGADISADKSIRVKSNMTITTVSRLVPYKNIADLIKALAIVKNTFFTIKLNIVGEGEEYMNLKGLVKNLDLLKNVQFYGFVPKHKNVLKIIKSSTIFCLPSGTEGFGITSIEAMSLGIPVILPNIPIHREITGCKGVIFYELNNYFDLAGKIIVLLKDKNLYSKLQHAALITANKYDWSKIAYQTQCAYENLFIN